MNSHRLLASGLLALVAAALTTPTASAGLMLSFDTTSTYTTSTGGSVVVSVYVSQTSGGVQVNASNPLAIAGIELSFATGGSASVLSPSAVTFGPAWDGGDAELSSSGGNTLVDVGLASINGVSNLSSALLLARFTFTASRAGTLGIQVAQRDPNSADFITLNGDIVDPTNTATGSIIVTPAVGAVPEPGSLILVALAGLIAAPIASRRARART